MDSTVLHQAGPKYQRKQWLIYRNDESKAQLVWQFDFNPAFSEFSHIALDSSHSLSLPSSQADKVLEPYNISPEVLDALLKNIKRRLTPQAVKIRADVEVMNFSYEGIDSIKEALKAAEALSTEEIPVKIKLVAPPLYVIMTQALDKDKGIEVLQNACDLITKMVKSKGGDVNIKTAPRAVSERDDRLLGLLMETLEKQNQEIDGDAAEDE